MLPSRVRRAQSSTFISRVPNMISMAQLEEQPLTLVACGDSLSEETARGLVQWLDMGARPVIAQIVSESAARRFVNPPASYVLARTWAELAGTWLDRGAKTQDSMNAARNAINTILSTTAPDQATVLNAWQTSYNRLIEDQGAGVLPWADVVDVCPAGAAAVPSVTIQQYHYYVNSMHAFDYAQLLVDVPAFTALRGQLAVPSPNPIEIPVNQFVISPNYQANWSAMDIDRKLAVLEMIYQANAETYNAISLASSVGVIFALCKIAGFTEAWFTNRVARIAELNPGLPIGDKITMAVVQDFQARYVKTSMNPDLVFNYIAALYGIFDETTLVPLRWVMEQARAQSMTHCLAYAETMCEFDFHPFLLMDKIADEVYAAFVRAAVSVIIDSWGSLFRPAYTTSTYVDLANLGVRARRVEDRKFKAYASDWVNGGLYSKLAIDSFIQACREQVEKLQEMAGDPIEMIRKILSDLTIREIGDAVYIYDNTGQKLNINKNTVLAHVEDQEEEEGEGEGGNPDGEDPPAPGAGARVPAPRVGGLRGGRLNIPEEQLLDQRRGWARAARDLPVNAVRMNIADLVILAKDTMTMTPTQLAVKKLCPMVMSAAQQSVINAYGDTANNIQILSRFNHAQFEAVNTILLTIGMTVRQVVPAYVDPAQPVNYNPNTMVTEDTLKRPRRAAFVAGNANIGGGGQGGRGVPPAPIPNQPIRERPENVVDENA